MIGGVDFTFSGLVLADDLTFIKKVVGEVWPTMFVEAGTFANPEEWFLYESKTACDSWATHGRTNDNANTMVCVLLGNDYITIVADAVEGVTGDLARKILEALQQRPERKVGVLPKCTPTTDARTSTALSTTTAGPSGSPAL